MAAITPVQNTFTAMQFLYATHCAAPLFSNWLSELMYMLFPIVMQILPHAGAVQLNVPESESNWDMVAQFPSKLLSPSLTTQLDPVRICLIVFVPDQSAQRSLTCGRLSAPVFHHAPFASHVSACRVHSLSSVAVIFTPSSIPAGGPDVAKYRQTSPRQGVSVA